MGQLMDDIVATAKSFTENFGDRGKFDYSFESLAEIDSLLDEASDYAVDEDTIYNICTMTGSYVFETARINYGGEYYWIPNEQQPVLVAGEPDFSVSIKAWEKVRGYLENGAEDSLSFYIAGYREHIEKGKMQKGYRATIV
ncbi:MAG: hypothetical protein K2O34_01020 [Acetatifactor sp.]|nr:hypothetical protein [Acetatifactor sp.]